MLLLTLLNILTQLNYKPLHDAGYRGEGITIAVIDGGFYRANDSTVFPQDHIIGVYDLLEGDTAASEQNIGIFDNPSDSHGTCCLSTMLYSDTLFTGTAPDANYILIRTEDYYKENMHEVERLARGMHLADSLGADVVTISLGYTMFDDSTTNYSYADMNGSSPAAKAALELARHDIIVCVAMGNDGNNEWHYLSTPADADSIFAVGAAEQSGVICNFSSYGPTSDGRVKPEVVAWGGNCFVYNPSYINPDTGKEGTLGFSNGTSFATPQFAGLIACLRQALPHMSAMELRQAVIEATSYYPQYTAQEGYGVPDIGYVFNGIRQALEDVNNSRENGVYKRLHNGNIVIIKGNDFFSPLGVRVK